MYKIINNNYFSKTISLTFKETVIKNYDNNAMIEIGQG